MEFSTGQPLAEYNRIYKETDQLYHNLALRMGLADSELVILYTLALWSGRGGPPGARLGETSLISYSKRAQVLIISPISYFVKPDLSRDKTKKSLGKKRRIS